MNVIAGNNNQMMGDTDWEALDKTLNPPEAQPPVEKPKAAEPKAEEPKAADAASGIKKTASSVNPRTGMIEESLDDLHAEVLEHQKTAQDDGEVNLTARMLQSIQSLASLAALMRMGPTQASCVMSVIKTMANAPEHDVRRLLGTVLDLGLPGEPPDDDGGVDQRPSEPYGTSDVPGSQFVG